MDTERVLENRIAVQKVPSVICDRRQPDRSECVEIKGRSCRCHRCIRRICRDGIITKLTKQFKLAHFTKLQTEFILTLPGFQRLRSSCTDKVIFLHLLSFVCLYHDQKRQIIRFSPNHLKKKYNVRCFIKFRIKGK